MLFEYGLAAPVPRFLKKGWHVNVNIMKFKTSRSCYYECLLQSQQIKERAPLTALSMAIKLQAAMQDVAKDKGIDFATATLSAKQTLWKQVLLEFNSHGVLSVNSRYKLNWYQENSIMNLCFHSSPSALVLIQKSLDQIPEKKGPYQLKVLSSGRWILGAAPKNLQAPWDQILKMNDFKQTLFFEICNQEAARQKGNSSGMKISIEEWNELCDYACWGGHALEMSEMSEEEVRSARRRLVEGDWVQVCKQQVLIKDPAWTIKDDFPGFTSKDANGMPSVSLSAEDLEKMSTAEQDARFKADLLALSGDMARLVHLADNLFGTFLYGWMDGWIDR